MVRALEPFDARSVEEASRKFWAARALPPATGILGPTGAPRVHQLFGTLSQEESALALLQRAVLADVEARFLAQAGRRSSGQVLVRAAGSRTGPAPTGETLRRIGVWIGSGTAQVVGQATESEKIQAFLERLAAQNVLLAREAPVRSCPVCRLPRTPAGIIYREQQAPTFLVRFPLVGSTPRTSLLVWVDSLWKLLGTTALLVHPTLPYVTARYRRHGHEETIVVSRGSVERIAEWLPGAELEIVSEVPGAELEGRRYDHPLAHEAPGLGTIAGPAGVVHASSEVTDSGTGTVTLVPSHGAGDATVGHSLGVAGWPVLDPDLTLSRGFAHKYQGLEVEAADAFILRDLSDGGYLFAQLTVRRGVPHCAVCGEPLVWETGRTWCLEPGRLPPDRLELLGRLLPGEAIPPTTESVPWPVSERAVEDEDAPELLDCPACGRLAPRGADPACPCGGRRVSARRRLLPVFQETLVAWARETPFPPGEGLRLYVAERRRFPSVVHHVVAIEAVDAHPGDVRLTTFPTVAAGPTAAELGPDEPIDALRSTLVGLEETPRAGPVTLADRRVAEARRLRKVWALTRELVDAMNRDGYAAGTTPIGARLAELLDEDRAFLSRFERLRVEVLRLYDLGRLARVQARLSRFFEEELRDGYVPLIQRRLESTGLPPDKAGAYSVLGHVLPLWAELAGPIAPFTSEAIHRTFRGESESVFERPHTPILEAVLDPRAERAYDRWRSVSRALARARRHVGLSPRTRLEKVVLYVRDEAAASELRQAAETLARLANVGSIDVASPNLPWEGKRVEAQPVLPAIQKVFGTGTPRVVRLLAGLPGRRVQEGIRSHSLQVAVEGRPVEILPTMVEFVESLPDGVLPIPWELGELFIQLPPGARTGEEGRPPPLTPDGFRLLRRVRRRLRSVNRPDHLAGLVIFAQGRLAEEMALQQTALSRYLKVPRIRVVASSDGFPAAESVVGRSGRGDRWMVWIPGAPAAPVRRKERAARATPLERRPAEADNRGVDFLSAPLLERENQIQDWVQRLDVALGRPVMGPAKLRYAWETGFHRYDDLVHAPFDQLAGIPGFGPQIAGEIVRAFGGSVPAGRSRPALRPAVGVPIRPAVTPPPADSRQPPLMEPVPVAIAEPTVTADPPTDLGEVPLVARGQPAERREPDPPDAVPAPVDTPAAPTEPGRSGPEVAPEADTTTELEGPGPPPEGPLPPPGGVPAPRWDRNRWTARLFRWARNLYRSPMRRGGRPESRRKPA